MKYQKNLQKRKVETAEKIKVVGYPCRQIVINWQKTFLTFIGHNFMSRTKRIYNNPILKKTQRYYIDNLPNDEILSPWAQGVIINVGIPFTYRSWICMGHCPQCRNHDKDYKIIRKRNKEELRRELIFYEVNYE